MVRTSNALALLKVLATAAWADSTFSQSEMNYIKELARRFSLEDEEWFALQPYLEDPPTEDETEAVIKDLLSRIGSPSERKAVVNHIEGVIAADDRISPEETELLRRYEEILNEPSSLDLMVKRLKSLLQTQQPHSRVDLDEFLRNKILFKLRRKTGNVRITPRCIDWPCSEGDGSRRAGRPRHRLAGVGRNTAAASGSRRFRRCFHGNTTRDHS